MGSNKLKYFFLMLLAALSTSACNTNSFDSKEAMWDYLKNEDNGYHFTKSINNIDFALTYKPTDLLVEQELTENYSRKDVENLRDKYKKYLYFTLSMSANGQELLNLKAGNRTEFGAMVNQLAFNMGNKINLIGQKRDTLPLIDYVYPRMYGMSNSTSMLLVYKRKQESLKQDYLRFTIEDMGFGTGEVAFKLGAKELINQPRLEF